MNKQSRRQIYGSRMITKRFCLITVKNFKSNNLLKKNDIVNRMKTMLDGNGGVMMDVKMNLNGDLLSYIVTKGGVEFNIEEEFRRNIIPELRSYEMSLVLLGPMTQQRSSKHETPTQNLFKNSYNE